MTNSEHDCSDKNGSRDKNDSKSAKTVSCPSCASEVLWLESNRYRPFCSESCKNRDFIGWANEERRVAGSSTYSDVFSEDMHQELMDQDPSR